MNAIILCEKLVKDVYDKFDASHDFLHIERVRKNALTIASTEIDINLELIELAVLLHDVSDPKYSNEGKYMEDYIIKQLEISDVTKDKIKKIIQSVSFNGGHETTADTIEAKIVRDADRLDAIGAIGIARAFAYGGAKGRQLYDINESPRENMSIEEYRSKQTASVTHFYEKLLQLADGMQTRKGKELAAERHAFMELFLENLRKETGESI